MRFIGSLIGCNMYPLRNQGEALKERVLHGSSFKSSDISWQLDESIEIVLTRFADIASNRRSIRATSDPDIPLALAITMMSFPGFLSLTTCINDDVAFVFAADLNLSIVAG